MCTRLYNVLVFQHNSSDVDEDAIKKVFEESGTVVKFKFFEYVIFESVYILITHKQKQPNVHFRYS